LSVSSDIKNPKFAIERM